MRTLPYMKNRRTVYPQTAGKGEMIMASKDYYLKRNVGNTNITIRKCPVAARKPNTYHCHGY
jgi:hypothetical protein